MGKLNFVLTNFLFWPIIVLTAVLLSSFQYQPGDFYAGYSDLTFFLLVGLIVFLTVIYYFIEHRLNGFKVHPVVFPVCFFLFGISIASIWFTSSQTFVNPNNGYTMMIIPSLMEKIKFSILVLLFFSSIYMMVFMFSRKTFRVKQMFWFLRLYVLFVIITISYSLIAEFDSVKAIFTTVEGQSTDLKSFLHNSNLFALFILYGIFALFVLNLFHSRFYNYLIIIAFYFYMVLTTCTATFIVGTIAIVIYIIFDLIRNVKKHWIMTLIISSILTVAVSSLVAAMSIAYNNNVGWIVNFFDYIQEEVISKDFSTFTGRTKIWKQVWENLINTDLVNLLIGRGFGTSDMLLKGYSMSLNSGNASASIVSTHNGLMGVLLTSGLIGLGFYLVLILFAIIAIIYLFCKKKGSFAATFAIVIFGVLGHSMAETVAFFSMNMLGIVITIMFMIPLFNAARATRFPKFLKQATEGDFAQNKMQHRKYRRLVSVFLSSIFIPILCLMVSKGSASVGWFDWFLPLLLILFGITYLLAPQIFTMFYKDASHKRYMFRLFFYPLLGILSLVGILIASNYVHWLSFIKEYTKLFVIIFVAGYELLLFVLFTIIKKDKFVEYLSDITIHTLKLVKICLPVALGVGLLGNFALDLFFTPTVMSVVCLVGIPFVLYLVLFATIPNREKYYYTAYLNEAALYNIKRTALKYNI